MNPYVVFVSTFVGTMIGGALALYIVLRAIERCER